MIVFILENQGEQLVGFTTMIKMIFVRYVINTKIHLEIVTIQKKLNIGDYVTVNSHFSQYLIIIPCL
jgi:hypothetical protein